MTTPSVSPLASGEDRTSHGIDSAFVDAFFAAHTAGFRSICLKCWTGFHEAECPKCHLQSGEDRTFEEALGRYEDMICLPSTAAWQDGWEAARVALLAAYRRVEGRVKELEVEQDEEARGYEMKLGATEELRRMAEARAERLEKALRHGVSLVMLMLKDVTQFPQPGMERFIEAGTAALADQEEGR